MDTWIKCKLGDAINLKRGYDLPSTIRRKGEFPIYSSSGISDFHSEAKVSGPGVVTGRYGTIGQVFFSIGDFWPLNTTLYVEDFKGNDPRFIYYFLQVFDFNKFNDKSAVPGINRNDLHIEPVHFPSIKEQKTIASVLSSLDNKIDLLHRQNKTLEALAETLFRYWFVDFGPVKARSEGREPIGIPAEIASLFPDEFEDSVIGIMPMGWQQGVLEDICINRREGVSPESISEDTPYIGLEHMPQECITLDTWGRAKEVKSNKSKFLKKDILFGKLRPYFHKVGVAPIDGVCSTDILVLAPKKREFFSLVLSYVSSDRFVDTVNLSSNGTRMPRTSWSVMKEYNIVIPPGNILKIFNHITEPLIEKILSNIFHSRTLVSIRDTLLPKLMSGQIRVKDAEKSL